MSRRKQRPMCTVAEILLIVVLLAGVTLLLRRGIAGYWRAAYPDTYRDSVLAASEKYEVPPSLVFAVIYNESHFSPDAVSSAGATGLMQVTDSTWEWVKMRGGGLGNSTDDLVDPVVNIDTGCCTLMLLSKMFENEETVLAAYNAGLGYVRGWLEDERYSDDGVVLHTIPFEETAQYVKKVCRTREIYQKLYGLP